MSLHRPCKLVLPILVLAATFAPAQQPPALPPINPGTAKLDQTIDKLPGPGLCIAASEPAGILAAGCESGKIVYWNKAVGLGVRVGGETPNVLEGHKGPVLALAFVDHTLASGGADGKAILWAMPDGKPQHTLATGGPVRALALSPDGKTLATSGGADVQLYDVASGKPGAKLSGHKDWVLCLAFSADGKQLVSGGYDEHLILWDVAGAKKVLDMPQLPPPDPKAPPREKVVWWSAAFSADGKTLALGGSDGVIQLVNPADGKVLRPIPPGHNSAITGLVFHPSGTLLVSTSKDRTIRLWNPANAQALKTLEGHTAWVQGVQLLAQGTRLATVGADQTVRLWELGVPPK